MTRAHACTLPPGGRLLRDPLHFAAGNEEKRPEMRYKIPVPSILDAVPKGEFGPRRRLFGAPRTVGPSSGAATSLRGLRLRRSWRAAAGQKHRQSDRGLSATNRSTCIRPGRIENAAEFSEHSVAVGVCNPAAMPGDVLVDNRPVSRQCCHCRLLDAVHQAAIALDVSGMGSCEMPLDRRRLHHGQVLVWFFTRGSIRSAQKV
jgi:hypothetical protein